MNKIAFGFCLMLLPGAAWAQTPSAEDMVCKLDPACNKAAAPEPAAGTTRHRRGLTVTGQASAEPTNAIDLNVPFKPNSAKLESDARITLDNLGQAMRDQRLATFTFMIGGHTDAKGSDAANLTLSERRAAAVRSYLMSHYQIAGDRLTAKGFGRTELLDPDHPEDGVNRRVQIVNTSASPIHP